MNLLMSRMHLMKFPALSKLKKHLKMCLEMKMQLKKLSQRQSVTTVMTLLHRTSALCRTSLTHKCRC